MVDIEAQNLTFDHLRIFANERITLIDDVVDTAAECPNIYLLTEAAFLEDELGSRVIYMTAEVTSSK